MANNVHQSHSQNASGDLRGVAGENGKLGCLCGKAGTSHVCSGSAHLSWCMVMLWLPFANIRVHISTPHSPLL